MLDSIIYCDMTVFCCEKYSVIYMVLCGPGCGHVGLKKVAMMSTVEQPNTIVTVENQTTSPKWRGRHQKVSYLSQMQWTMNSLFRWRRHQWCMWGGANGGLLVACCVFIRHHDWFIHYCSITINQKVVVDVVVCSLMFECSIICLSLKSNLRTKRGRVWCVLMREISCFCRSSLSLLIA
jgi:hypothetical protein